MMDKLPTIDVFRPLLEHQSAQKLMRIVSESGFEIRFIGGCVRDALLNMPMGDMDMASNALPETMMNILGNAGIKTIPTGIDHGTITAHLDGHDFEITTLRKDISTDGRHADVTFTHDWQEDALRRDFTINAMSVDQEGNLHDYFNGLNDLQARHLRFVGDAEKRIQEDYLRLLRYFRFASVLNWTLDDTAVLNICRNQAQHLVQLSRERIQNELYKLLLGAQASAICRLIDDYTILHSFKPDRTGAADLLDYVISQENAHDMPDAFRRLLAWCSWHDSDLLERLVVLTRDQKKRLKALEYAAQDLDKSIEHMLYFYGVDTLCDVYWLHQKEIPHDILQQWTKPDFPLTAEDVMQSCNLSGVALGNALKQAEKWWVSHNFEPNIDSLLEYVRKL